MLLKHSQSSKCKSNSTSLLSIMLMCLISQLLESSWVWPTMPLCCQQANAPSRLLRSAAFMKRGTWMKHTKMNVITWLCWQSALCPHLKSLLAQISDCTPRSTSHTEERRRTLRNGWRNQLQHETKHKTRSCISLVKRQTAYAWLVFSNAAIADHNTNS